jgi:hypothetical protein
VFVKTTEEAARTQRYATAQRVIESLRQQLPACRLLCFLDDEEWQPYPDEDGVPNRGFYRPVAGNCSFWLQAPIYILEHLVVDGTAFEDFIYVCGSTCSSTIGLTMTLAHELQHFAQHGEQEYLWAANSLIPNLSKATVRALGLRSCDVPHEREARIVAKRTAEGVFGVERVQQYIDSKIAKAVTECEAADWECIRGLATSTPYDLARETKLFYPRLKDHRLELEQALRELQSELPGFPQVDLDELLEEGTS